jgi:hypothetical protein
MMIIQPLQPTGAAISAFQGVKVLQAAPAAELGSFGGARRGRHEIPGDRAG